jgi:mitogen-activated protein kinase 1/3
MKQLKHDNLVALKDILNPLPRKDFKDIYIVTDLMDADLHQIIESGQELTEDHVQYFMYQMLCGLKVMRTGILRRDRWRCVVSAFSECVPSRFEAK